jgi:ankyrin repeat protein
MPIGIWRAAWDGDLAEVERLVGQDPGLLDARDVHGRTPLAWACDGGRVGVVRWLLDKVTAIYESHYFRYTALWWACFHGHPPVVRLLLERGADPTIANVTGSTPLITASQHGSPHGRLEIVRLLLGHPGGKATINRHKGDGTTALWWACQMGRGGVVRALLGSGADLTVAKNDGTTPMAVAKQPAPLPDGATAEGRRECVAALEVRLLSLCPLLGDLPFWSAG